jgi:hypothetical protein
MALEFEVYTCVENLLLRIELRTFALTFGIKVFYLAEGGEIEGT